MSEIKQKVLVHFNTSEVTVYRLNGKTLTLLYKENTSFDETFVNERFLDKIDQILSKLEKCVGSVDNKNTRLYATGIFQNFAQADQTKLIIHVYVNFGVYFNVIQPDLENFYLQNSMSICGELDIMKGVVCQEFRKVVICGSFQQYLQDIDKVMVKLQRHNISVLSPWTTKIVPESSGTDFILLEGQEPLKNKRDAWRHKYEHMNKFRQADAVIVCNPDGLIGQGTMFEFGFMVAFSKRIICIKEPKELSITFPYEIGLNF